MNRALSSQLPENFLQAVIERFIPPNAVPDVVDSFDQYGYHLQITKPRRTKLGDYRPPVGRSNHLITVNNDLNPYAFLITLLHEIAHLVTWDKYQHKVKAHGAEWKLHFRHLMVDYLGKGVFPPDLEGSLKSYLINPKASSCNDVHLMRMLRQYDGPKRSVHVEEILTGAYFRLDNGRVFKKGDRIRKRYRCMEVATKRLYLFSPIAEVMPVEPA